MVLCVYLLIVSALLSHFSEAITDLGDLRKASSIPREEQVPLFLMTDLFDKEWKSKYVANFEPLGYKVKFTFDLQEEHEEVHIKLFMNSLLDSRFVVCSWLSTKSQPSFIQRLK